MDLKILADESVDFRIVNQLANKGFEVISVLQNYQGILDKEVLKLARQYNALLLTEDSDFGEWIFAHRERAVGVIFLRYKSGEYINISHSLLKVLNKYGASLYGKFVVITTKKIRIRQI